MSAASKRPYRKRKRAKSEEETRLRITPPPPPPPPRRPPPPPPPNPVPDPERWAEVRDPEERLTSALTELYGWYDLKQDMVGNTLRDAPLVPALGEVMGEIWGGYMDRVVSALSAGWPYDPKGGAALHVMLRVAVDFHTWRILDASGLDNDEAAEVASRMVTGALAATCRPSAPAAR
jgi:hypothetical protein